jgi:predicted Rossmann fold nucleotide-binding protein DprA/Smf involved in DNA uptake
MTEQEITSIIEQAKNAIQQIRLEIEAIDIEIETYKAKIIQLENRRTELVNMLNELGIKTTHQATYTTTVKDEEVYNYLKEHGPQSIKQLAEAFEVAYRQMNWAIWRLKRAGKVRQVERGKYEAI